MEHSMTNLTLTALLLAPLALLHAADARSLVRRTSRTSW